MNLRYKCLILDHDDTITNSAVETNFPNMLESLAILRPGEEKNLTIEDFLLGTFQGYQNWVQQRYGYTQEEMDWQYPAPPEQVLVIHTLTMPPEMSGKGYGTRMVRFAMEEARRMGCRVIRLDTYVGNLPAQRLYSKLGFRISGRKLVSHHGLFDSELFYLEYALPPAPRQG